MGDANALTPGIGTNRRQVMTAAAAACVGISFPYRAWAADDGVLHSAENIRQEPVFTANRSRVYQTLTVAQEFEQVVRLSAASKTMPIGSKPSEISKEVGGAFSLFGGYIIGRHLELSPNERIVQAWRAQSWPAGAYSIVSFVLKEHGTGTTIAFDHRGFPDGLGQHLAEGWRINYWEPMEKYLNAH